jgi:hypothetical protein
LGSTNSKERVQIMTEQAQAVFPPLRTYLTPTEPFPTMDDIENWVYDDVCDATDDCQVEPDGKCPHGHVSWLLYLGYI